MYLSVKANPRQQSLKRRQRYRRSVKSVRAAKTRDKACAEAETHIEQAGCSCEFRVLVRPAV